jgi:uncharacterized membrane protein YphA (DoxX/SURF4 family)
VKRKDEVLNLLTPSHWRRWATSPLGLLRKRVDRVGARVVARLELWLVRHSIGALRISMGAVFFGFGVLKFFPDVSPAQRLTTEIMNMLSFGLVPASVSIVLVASLECAIGLCLLTGRWLRIGVWLLGLEVVGILLPLVLVPGELFSGPSHAPNLKGQYVLKDVVLAGAAMVIAATMRGGHLVEGSAARSAQREDKPHEDRARALAGRQERSAGASRAA